MTGDVHHCFARNSCLVELTKNRIRESLRTTIIEEKLQILELTRDPVRYIDIIAVIQHNQGNHQGRTMDS